MEAAATVKLTKPQPWTSSVYHRSHICHCCRLVRRDSSARKSVSEMPLGQLLWSSRAMAGSLLTVEQCASQYCRLSLHAALF